MSIDIYSVTGLNLYAYASNTPTTICYESNDVSAIYATNTPTPIHNLNIFYQRFEILENPFSSLNSRIVDPFIYTSRSNNVLKSFYGLPNKPTIKPLTMFYLLLCLKTAISVLENLNNPGLTDEQKCVAILLDLGFNILTTALSMIFVLFLSKASVTIGSIVCGMFFHLGVGIVGSSLLGAVATIICIVLFSALISFVLNKLTDWWKMKKKEWFNL